MLPIILLPCLSKQVWQRLGDFLHVAKQTAEGVIVYSLGLGRLLLSMLTRVQRLTPSELEAGSSIGSPPPPLGNESAQ